MIINRTTKILQQSGRRKQIEISVKRKFIRDWNTKEWVDIQRMAKNSTVYSDYYLEILNHDLALAFSPKYKTLPFVRITDPRSGGIWVLWFVGWDDFTPLNPIQPELIDYGDGYVEFRLDADTRLRFEILGHLIRKLLIVEKRPIWNRLKFRISRANALLLDGATVGTPHKRLIAFPKNATFEDNPIFWFSEPKAWDSKDPAEPRQLSVNYDVQPVTGAVWDLTITLNPDELDNAVYPVYIDPTIVLQPDASEGYDNYIYNTSPGTINRGIAPDLRILKESAALQRTLIKFDLSSIPSGATINSSVLHLNLYHGWYTMQTVYANRILVSWEEGYANGSTVPNASCWNYRSYDTLPWDSPGASTEGIDISPLAESQDINGVSDINIDLTTSTQEIINGEPNWGWRLRCSESVYKEGDSFYSSDYSDPALHPKLTIDYAEDGGGVFIPAKIGAIAGKGIISPLAKK